MALALQRALPDVDRVLELGARGRLDLHGDIGLLNPLVGLALVGRLLDRHGLLLILRPDPATTGAAALAALLALLLDAV